jgi:dTDP-4-dehydrorhamnose 3,5-epimerase-like enzyme
LSGITVRPSAVLGVPVVSYWYTDRDPRGLFAVPLQFDGLDEAGLRLPPLVQTNVSVSDRPGTVRGIHVSNNLKYVAALGPFTNVVVCLDPRSSRFGRHECVHLRPGTALVVPAGWGNGLVNHDAGAVYLYWMDGPFDGDKERVIAPTDPDLAIGWPHGPVARDRLSDKDAAGMSLAEYLADPVPLPDGPADPRDLLSASAAPTAVPQARR